MDQQPRTREAFRRLLAQKRVEQLEAVQKLPTLDDEKQDSLLSTMMDKMKHILLLCRQPQEKDANYRNFYRQERKRQKWFEDPQPKKKRKKLQRAQGC